MRYSIYRERRLATGAMSYSVMVEWPDQTLSHEEIEQAAGLPEEQISGQIALLWRQRPKEKPSNDAQRDRKKEWGALAANVVTSGEI